MTRRRLTLNNAMDLMRRPDARMIQTNTRTQAEHWITPSGSYIDPALAAAIKAHPQVRAGADALFPGMSQTWRVSSSADAFRVETVERQIQAQHDNELFEFASAANSDAGSRRPRNFTVINGGLDESDK